MKDYDYIVVGSGIGGLTVARILSQHHHRVLLLELASILGGSLARFRLRGIPFDVGFHFTGGFRDDGTGMLDQLLGILGVRDRIQPVFFPRHATHRMIFPAFHAEFVIPSGLQNSRDRLAQDFPGCRRGIDRYFERFQNVVDATPTLAVSGFGTLPIPLEEDGLTLQQVLDDCHLDPMLRTILGGWSMCYGTPPSEVAFSTHCRASHGLSESLARVENGGDAFVDALVDVLRRDHVDIRTRTSIRQCLHVQDQRVTRFLLTDGTEVGAKACIFTIHPRNILGMLPPEHVSKAFRSRIGGFEPSNGFFSLYGTIDRPRELGPIALISIMPGTDLNAMLTPQTPEVEEGPMMVLRSCEQGPAGPVHTVTALEVAFQESTRPWEQSRLKRRPPEYRDYKQQRTHSIQERMGRFLPECRDMHLLDSASMLSYRDYLHSPDGSAYGIRQKLGQFNLFGRLPLKNLYAAGQSAILPGVLGSMMSAFLVCRGIIGLEAFLPYVSRNVPCTTVS